jgi:hypothetical protein
VRLDQSKGYERRCLAKLVERFADVARHTDKGCGAVTIETAADDMLIAGALCEIAGHECMPCVITDIS